MEILFYIKTFAVLKVQKSLLQVGRYLRDQEDLPIGLDVIITERLFTLSPCLLRRRPTLAYDNNVPRYIAIEILMKYPAKGF